MNPSGQLRSFFAMRGEALESANSKPGIVIFTHNLFDNPDWRYL
jgi:hypothetical protein